MIGMRLKIPDELQVLVVIHAPEGDRLLTGHHRQPEARIGRAIPRIDPGEHLADLIRRNQRPW